jgi:hypothetical protein
MTLLLGGYLTKLLTSTLEMSYFLDQYKLLHL